MNCVRQSWKRWASFATLQSYCEEVSEQYNVSVTFDGHGRTNAIPTAVALCVYRVTQEALDNVVQHSGASFAQVQLIADDQQLSPEYRGRWRRFRGGGRRARKPWPGQHARTAVRRRGRPAHRLDRVARRAARHPDTSCCRRCTRRRSPERLRPPVNSARGRPAVFVSESVGPSSSAAGRHSISFAACVHIETVVSCPLDFGS